MKTGLKIVVLAAMLLSLAFASQASADNLGDKLALKLCIPPSHKYELTTLESVQWSGNKITGTYTHAYGAGTETREFHKLDPYSDFAGCTVRGSNGSCIILKVTKSGNDLHAHKDRICK